MDDKKIVHDETYKKSGKIEAVEPEQRSNSENIDVAEVPSRVGYHSLPVHFTVTSQPKRKDIVATPKRKTYCEKMLPSEPTTLLKHGNSDLKSKLNRSCPIRPESLQPDDSSVVPIPRHTFELQSELNRFRSIRPKPLQPDDSSVVPVPRHTSEVQPDMMNITTSPSNRVFVPSTVQVKKNITPSDSNTINKSDTNNSNSNLNDSYSDNNSCRKNSSSCNKKHSRITKTIFRPRKDSIQLFFESMAQTMLSLPKEEQARIKMQVCEIVTNAEIRYCESQAKSKTKN